ncbi:calcium-binding protein [Haloterrigena salifodinae]|uniref:Calcium-binding protein n=2 Tax=Haloterrigena salifodinae TaxID=2675099 RepID=A0A8T8E7H8_9EURY|nr:calcium-binding protein [Haloterrigena salifodinae]
MAKGALATGALTLGTGAFGTATVGAQGDQVAVFANNYYPGGNFDVIAPLQTSTTVEVLQLEGETIPEISQPDEWSGHIIRYDIGQQSGITTFLFVRGQSLSADDSGTMGEEASVLSSDLNLLNTTLGSSGATTDTTEDTGDVVQEDTSNVTEEEPTTTGNDTTANMGGD